MSDFSEENAMCLVATMVAEDLSNKLGIDETKALGMFLVSRTGSLLFDPSLKLWWDGPASVADVFLNEAGLAERDAL